MILDLFAGTGWSVACQQLGLDEIGVDNMPEVIATRAANGMATAFENVWDGLDGTVKVPWYSGLIASPPCQTFSNGGKGAGRAALDQVLQLIDEQAYLRVEDMRAFGEEHDDRTALVLTPLAYAVRHRPRWVLLEQVPPVLPVWEDVARVLREHGYSTWTGVLSAEQYGVPQTRRRAVLIARLDGEAAPPEPTHSRYYVREPQRLDDGVLPWVSMAQALGWGRSARPSVTATGGGTAAGGAEPLGNLAREVSASNWIMRSSQSVAGVGRAERPMSEPGFTVTQTTSRAKWMQELHGDAGSGAASDTTPVGSRVVPKPGNQGDRVTVDEAAVLQSYPAGFVFCGSKSKQYLQIGNAVPPLLARALLQAVHA